MAKLACQRGIAAVPLVEPVRELFRATGKEPVIPYDGHYRPVALGAMAELLAAQLLELEAGH